MPFNHSLLPLMIMEGDQRNSWWVSVGSRNTRTHTHWTRLPSLQPVTTLPLSSCRCRRGQQNFLWIRQAQLQSQATHRIHVPAILLFMHTNLKHVSVQSTPGLHRKGTDYKPCKSITCYVFMTGDSTSWISLQELASCNRWTLQTLTVLNHLLSSSVTQYCT